eukprot:gene57225-78410_t
MFCASLSFLGPGLRPPLTTWGVMLNEAQNINVVALYPWLLYPVVPVILIILAFNFLDGLRVVIDCAHGAAYRVAPAVFAELGAQVVSIGVSPNGLNINEDCGSTHLEALKAALPQCDSWRSSRASDALAGQTRAHRSSNLSECFIERRNQGVNLTARGYKGRRELNGVTAIADVEALLPTRHGDQVRPQGRLSWSSIQRQRGRKTIVTNIDHVRRTAQAVNCIFKVWRQNSECSSTCHWVRR